MDLTRRQFVVATTTAAAAAMAPISLGSPLPLPRETTTWIDGDPYLATVVEAGLGGRDFRETQDRAMRLRTSPELRDRYVLGLEMPDA